MVGARMNYNCIPHWLQILLGEKFFNPCLIHETCKKHEKNIFCLDCCTSFCPHCLSSHRPHNLLQIRRYVYHDVIRLSDAQKLMNCSLVQPYTTNSAKVIFLNQRPISRPFRGSGKLCITCDRSLQDPYLFCSLSCKVPYMVSTGAGIQEVDDSEFLQLQSETRTGNLSELEETEINPDSNRYLPSSLSEAKELTCTLAADQFVKKKRSCSTAKSVPRVLCKSRCSPAGEIADVMNRRKGVPQRAPLH